MFVLTVSVNCLSSLVKDTGEIQYHNSFSMEEVKELSWGERKIQGSGVRCVGKLTHHTSYVVSNGFKIPPKARETVSIKVFNGEIGESVWVVPGLELVGLLSPFQVARVLDGHIYLQMHNWSYVPREVKAETIVCQIGPEEESWCNIVPPRKEQQRMAIVAKSEGKLLKWLSVTLKDTEKTEAGRRIYC